MTRDHELSEPGHETQEGTVCPSCAAYIGVNEVFCPACRAPISLFANTDPLARIQTEGFLYGRAVDSRPKMIVVFCIWLVFLPVALFCGMVVIGILTGGAGSGAGGFVIFWIAAVLAVFSVVLLYRVTKNYITKKPREFEE